MTEVIMHQLQQRISSLIKQHWTQLKGKLTGQEQQNNCYAYIIYP